MDHPPSKPPDCFVADRREDPWVTKGPGAELQCQAQGEKREWGPCAQPRAHLGKDRESRLGFHPDVKTADSLGGGALSALRPGRTPQVRTMTELRDSPRGTQLRRAEEGGGLGRLVPAPPALVLSPKQPGLVHPAGPCSWLPQDCPLQQAAVTELRGPGGSLHLPTRLSGTVINRSQVQSQL